MDTSRCLSQFAKSSELRIDMNHKFEVNAMLNAACIVNISLTISTRSKAK